MSVSFLYHFPSLLLTLREPRQEKVENPCKFDGCGCLFTSLTSLNRHKIANGHSKRDENRRHPSINTKKKTAIKQRLSVSQLLNTGELAGSSSDDQLDKCDASTCIIKTNRSKMHTVDCIQCDICKKWLHTFCIGIKASLEEYFCKLCA